MTTLIVPKIIKKSVVKVDNCPFKKSQVNEVSDQLELTFEEFSRGLVSSEQEMTVRNELSIILNRPSNRISNRSKCIHPVSEKGSLLPVRCKNPFYKNLTKKADKIDNIKSERDSDHNSRCST